MNKNFELEVANLVERIRYFERGAALETSSVGDTIGLKKEVERYVNRNNALEFENKMLKETIAEMKKEEILRTDNALESIELLNFIERMRDKYLYVSDVEENDYEPDEEKRKKSRDMFRKR